jgi:hypothetical protein
MRLRNVLIASSIAAFASFGTLGCAATSDDAASSSAAELIVLNPADCTTPTTSEAPLKDSSGNPIANSAKTTLSGCITGQSGETGDALATRIATLLSDTAKFGTVEDSPGHALFSGYTMGQPSGSLTGSGGLVQDVDVTLNEQYSPTTRLRFTRKKASDGSVSVNITNVTALTANVLFGVTVVNPNDLSVSLTFKPAANGVTANGSGQVIMQQGGDHAGEVSSLVKAVFDFTTTHLAH